MRQAPAWSVAARAEFGVYAGDADGFNVPLLLGISGTSVKSWVHWVGCTDAKYRRMKVLDKVGSVRRLSVEARFFVVDSLVNGVCLPRDTAR